MKKGIFIASVAFVLSSVFSCMEVEFSFDPKKDSTKKYIVATLKGEVTEKKDCKVAEYVVSSFYKLAGKPTCKEPFLALTLNLTIPFYIPVVKSPAECTKPVCVYYNSRKKRLHLVSNRNKLKELQTMIDEFSSGLVSAENLKFSIIPKGRKINAMNVYIGEKPVIHYEGKGNVELTFSTFKVCPAS